MYKNLNFFHEVTMDEVLEQLSLSEKEELYEELKAELGKDAEPSIVPPIHPRQIKIDFENES